MRRWLSRTRRPTSRRWNAGIRSRSAGRTGPRSPADAELAAEEARGSRTRRSEAQEGGTRSGRSVSTCRPPGRGGVRGAARGRGHQPDRAALEVHADRTPTEEGAPGARGSPRRRGPQGASVRAEPSAAVGWEITSQNSFSMFGGFGPGLGSPRPARGRLEAPRRPGRGRRGKRRPTNGKMRSR